MTFLIDDNVPTYGTETTKSELMKFLAISLTFDRSYALCGSSPIDALLLRYFSGITKKKELVCSIDETWLPVVVDGQTDEQKIEDELKSKFLFPIDSDLPNHRRNITLCRLLSQQRW